VRTSSPHPRKLAVEALALGLGYTAVLIWIGSALVGSFGSEEWTPYWSAIPLRTDTAGAIAFGVAIITLVTSRYLELRRRNGGPVQPVQPAPEVRPPGVLAVLAVADIAMFLGTAMVIYLSCNAFTHPVTLNIQLTHLLPWPSEGTVRVVALGVCLLSVSVRRYLRATAARPGQPAAVPEEAGVVA
jgi:hypothetical protein